MRKQNYITTIALTTIVGSFLIGLCWSFLHKQDGSGCLLFAKDWLGPVVLIFLFFKLVSFVSELR
jgi:hypothetical protein